MSAATENIKEMLAGIDAETAQLEQRLAKLKDRATTLRDWLAEEEPQQTILPISAPDGAATPLSSFLRRTLADGRPRSAAELGELAHDSGLIDNNKSPGRVVHFALIGLQQHALVDKNEEGWIAVAKKPQLRIPQRA